MLHTLKSLPLALLASVALAGPLTALPVLAMPAAPVQVRSQDGIHEYKLANGLKVLLVPNHAAPVVSVMLVYRVGSRNEAVGYTGATHFLEHMLFKGTPTFNKEKGTQIAKLLLAQGARFNATTWLDRTNYFETLPADQLDLALQIESDRMRNALISDADRQSEMTVVRNELERGENNPDRVMWLNLFANAFMAHPYHHPTIGWRADVEGVPTERLKKFYEDFYYPNNATLIVVGDMDPAKTLSKINGYFGPIAASREPIPEVYTQEPPQQGERRFVIRRPGQLGIVNMGFRVPPLEHTDSAALDLLSGVLSQGVSSRLQQALVDSGQAVSVSAWSAQLRDPGLFTLSAKLASGQKHEVVEQNLLKVLEDLKSKPVPAAELERVKNQLLAQFHFQRHGTLELANQLGEYEASADWRYMLTYPERLQAVSAADIQRVARTYFVDHNRTVGHFVPDRIAEVQTQERNLSYPAGQQNSPLKTAQASEAAAAQYFELGKARLIVQENPIDQTVALRLNLRAGSIYDPPGKAGLAELTAGMLERGTRRLARLDLAQALENMGSTLQFSADLERATVVGRALSPQLNKTLDLLFEMLEQPRFETAEFDKFKKQKADQLRQRLDNTDQLAREGLYAALYPAGHPYALDTASKLQQLEALSLADVKAFYQQHYGSQQLIMTLVGDVKAQTLKPRIQKALARLKADNPVAISIPEQPTQLSGETQIKTLRDKANVSIAMGLQTDIKLGHPDYFAAVIANHALGQSSLTSRLGLRVRDELGLTYGIYSYFPEAGLGSSPWLVGVTTNPDKVKETIGASQEVIAKYRAEGISEEEFALAKSSLIGSYLVSLSTNPQIAERLTDAAFYGLGDNYVRQRAEQIQAVSREQVNAMIQKYFDPARLSVMVVGNYE